MTVRNSVAQLGTAERPASSGLTWRRTRLLPWIALTCVFAAALWLRHVSAANTDVSWLITVAERVLDGQQLYVDVVETNPPMAMLVYVPAVLLARAIHMPVEVVTDALVFVAIAVSLGITARILKHSTMIDDVNGWSLTILGFAVLAVMPTQTFAQREHIALIELLPALAVMALRMNDEKVPPWAIIVAGVGAGLMLCFKPFFAIGYLSGVAAMILYARAPRLLWAPEHLIAAGCVGVYALDVVVLYPAFFTVIGPLVRDVYLPVGLSAGALLAKPAVTIWIAAILAGLLLKRSGRLDPAHVLLLAILALGDAVASRRPVGQQGMLRASAIATLAVLFAASMAWFDVAFDARPLQDAMARLGSPGPHPKILAITPEPGIGHPLVRAVDGIWVSRQQAIWVTAYLDYMEQHGQLDPQTKTALAVYADRERAMLAEDIRKNPPDVVLVDNLTADSTGWLHDHQDIAGLIAGYRRAATVNHIDLLTKLD